MSDILLRTTAGDGAIRIFVSSTKETVDHASKIHKTTPVVSAALGRLLTGGIMMGSMMKDETDLLTLQINSEGPIEQLVVVANNKGQVKGYPRNPQVDLEANSNNVLPVGEAVGPGSLTVSRDLGLKKPYMGQTPLVSGEIAEDLTYYYAKSEQIPSAVALGVLVDRDHSIKQAGGFIIQLLPFASEEVINKLEEMLETIPPVTSMMEDGMDAEDILRFIAEPFGINEDITELPLTYHCDCDRDRMERALISLGEDDVRDLLSKDNGAELSCQFCDTVHNFTKEDLENIIEIIRNS